LYLGKNQLTAETPRRGDHAEEKQKAAGWPRVRPL
jgi:hypothetical protein